VSKREPLNIDARAAWDGRFTLRGGEFRFRHPDEIDGVEAPVAVGTTWPGLVPFLWRWIVTGGTLSNHASTSRIPHERFLARVIDAPDAKKLVKQMRDIELSLSIRAWHHLHGEWLKDSILVAVERQTQAAKESAARAARDEPAGASQAARGPQRRGWYPEHARHASIPQNPLAAKPKEGDA